jgi:hypothetical protein
MGNRIQRLPLAAVLSAIVLAILVSACGGSSSDSSTGSAPTSSAAAEGSGNPEGGGNHLSLGEKGAANSFIKPNSPNNKYAKYGSEASSAELNAASEVLAENLEARESADFAAQCATLSVQANEEISGAKGSSKAKSLCPAALKKLATPLKSTKEHRADNFGGLIAALRVKGGATAYALYHGTDGKDWMMPMYKEGSTWKVTSITGTEV